MIPPTHRKNNIALVVSVILALATGIFASVVGFDRDRAYYATVICHGHLIENSGVPVWWPMFCGSYDVTAAAYSAWLLRRRGTTTQPA